MPSLPPTHKITRPDTTQVHTPLDQIHDFYCSTVWRRLRKIVLDGEPMCRTCMQDGRLTVAEVVDHIVPISRGGARLDVRNTQPLCDRCHNIKRATGDKR